MICQAHFNLIGSTLGEIMAGRRPYEGIPDATITELYIKGNFHDVTSMLCGDVITSCWKGRMTSAEEVLELFSLCLRLEM